MCLFSIVYTLIVTRRAKTQEQAHEKTNIYKNNSTCVRSYTKRSKQVPELMLSNLSIFKYRNLFQLQIVH